MSKNNVKAHYRSLKKWSRWMEHRNPEAWARAHVRKRQAEDVEGHPEDWMGYEL
jgi:hypothetical protein